MSRPSQPPAAFRRRITAPAEAAAHSPSGETLAMIKLLKDLRKRLERLSRRLDRLDPATHQPQVPSPDASPATQRSNIMNPGLSPMITWSVPATWTAEQALAVFDLLDDLRDRVWAHYERQLRDLMSQPYQPTDPMSDQEGDLPF
jgi:uncharacterized membrane protein YccC